MAGRTPASWTPEHRKRQAEQIHQWSPWLKSSGPKTFQGKAAVANNALKHGRDSRAVWSARRVAVQLKRLELKVL